MAVKITIVIHTPQNTPAANSDLKAIICNMIQIKKQKTDKAKKKTAN